MMKNMNVVNKISRFSMWSLVYLCIIVLWLVFEQYRGILSGDGMRVFFWPVLAAVFIMTHYERRLRKRKYPEVAKSGPHQGTRRD
jgi:uncharacterized membrane protein YqjE